MKQDDKAKALAKLRASGSAIDDVGDDELRALRTACTHLLKMSPEDRRKVIEAAEALG